MAYPPGTTDPGEQTLSSFRHARQVLLRARDHFRDWMKVEFFCERFRSHRVSLVLVKADGKDILPFCKRNGVERATPHSLCLLLDNLSLDDAGPFVVPSTTRLIGYCSADNACQIRREAEKSPWNWHHSHD
jgi:hypothetical protein